MERYIRNRIYISKEEQKNIQGFKVLIAGAGIGSFIAEAALRMGFENLTIVDGDTVELSNMNRQNYIDSDFGKSKAISLKRRLLYINPNANIEIIDQFITDENIHEIIGNYNAAINALDFSSNVPFVFDSICQSKRIPVLHPYNIGWYALVFVIIPEGQNLTDIISSDYRQFEKKAVRYVLENLVGHNETKNHIQKVLSSYVKESGILPPPQLSAASFLLAGTCTRILFELANKSSITSFPKFYFLGKAN